MRNITIREAAKKNEVRLWEIAYALGIEDSTFSRRLRRELSEREQKKILEIIERIAAERKEER